MVIRLIRNYLDDLKSQVIGVGIIHLSLLLYGLFRAIYELILEEEPVDFRDVSVIGIHVLFQAFIIYFLIAGALKDVLCYVVVWLIATFPICALMTYYILIYSDINYLSQVFVNVIVIGFLSYTWLVVLRFYLQSKNRYRGIQSKRLPNTKIFMETRLQLQ